VSVSKTITVGAWELVQLEDGRFRVKEITTGAISEPMSYDELACDYPFLASRYDQCDSKRI
jgi:hypothetical protein